MAWAMSPERPRDSKDSGLVHSRAKKIKRYMSFVDSEARAMVGYVFTRRFAAFSWANFPGVH